MVVGLADTMMVSYAGEAVVAGVGLDTMIYTIFIYLFTAISAGGAVVVSQYIGSRNHENAETAASQIFHMSGLLSLVCMVLMLLFGSDLLKAMYPETEPAAMEACRTVYFGEMLVQIGYCNGHNSLLNAVEYHRSSEINVAATDAILLVGMEQDIEDDFTYDTAKMEAFLLPAGAAVELYATTLHYAPCGVKGAGFQVAVVLPKGTNYPLNKEHAKADSAVQNEDILLAATNKWLIGHAEGGLDAGAFIGLKGRNLNVCE